MSEKNIYSASSFWGLKKIDKRKVIDFANNSDKRLLDVRDYYLNRLAYGEVLADGTAELERLNIISPAFNCLDSAQKKAMEGQLMLIYYQLSTQYELNRIERMSHQLPAIAEQIKLCAQLINQLRLTSVEPKLSQELLKEIASSGKHTRYFGLKLIVPALLESVDTFASKKKSVTDFISFINERRLYWVWAGSSVGVILSSFPDYMAHTGPATYTLGWTGFIGGSLSWILYFMRGGLAWCGLIEHTVALTEEERALGISFKDRLSVQWNLRKYQILNDSIWGVCNCACFFVLVGSGLLGNVGNAFTASLLLMDAILNVWRMYEEEAAHLARMRRYHKELSELEGRIRWAKKMQRSAVAHEMAYDELKHKIAMAELEWRYKKTITVLDLLYSTCLLAAFVVLCSSIFFGPVAALTLAVAGTIICFALNLAYNTATMAVNVSKAKHLQQDVEVQISEKLEHFKQLCLECSQEKDETRRSSIEGQLKMCYLQLKSLRAESSYQQKVISHQRLQLVISTLRDALIPPLVIVSLALLPLGFGVPLLVLSLTLAVGLYWFLQKTTPEKEKPLSLFPENEYKRFSQHAISDSPKQLLTRLSAGKREDDPGIETKFVYN